MVRSSWVIKAEIDEKEGIRDALNTLSGSLTSVQAALTNIGGQLVEAGNIMKDVGKVGTRTLDNNGKFGEKGKLYNGYASDAGDIIGEIATEVGLLDDELEALRTEFNNAVRMETLLEYKRNREQC